MIGLTSGGFLALLSFAGTANGDCWASPTKGLVDGFDPSVGGRGVVMTEISSFNFTSDINEAGSLTESVGTSADAALQLAETESVSDAVTAAVPYVVSVNELVGVGDSASAKLGALAGLADSSSLGDSIANALGASQGLVETCSVSDVVAVAASLLVSISEGSAIGNALSVLAAFSASASESVTASESVIMNLGVALALLDDDALAELIDTSSTSTSGGPLHDSAHGNMSRRVVASAAMLAQRLRGRMKKL